MPTPLELLIDPVSLGILFLYATLIFIEMLKPARALPYVKGWSVRAFTSFIIYFYLAAYLPLLWDQFFRDYQLFDLSSENVFVSAFCALLVYQLLVYVWHRLMHESNVLWRMFHQMHHSVERVDTFGAFYFSPLDMMGFTLVGSLSGVLIIGLSAQATTYFLFVSMFLVIFSHTNIRTPQWLGYFIQRPESHSVHHGKGIHRYNYSELPIFDIVFGTFRNPPKALEEVGFYHGASKRVPEMLLFRDVTHEHTNSAKDN